jgi:hypothetical protein
MVMIKQGAVMVKKSNYHVIPLKRGIHKDHDQSESIRKWIPAFAGIK